MLITSIVTKALDAETNTESAGFKTEAVYLKTEADAQGSRIEED